MATDQDKQTPTAPPVFKWDDIAWNGKLRLLETSKKEVAGKVGYNPFLYFHVHVTPLLIRYNKNERSKELLQAMLSLPSSIPALTLPPKK
jgi:hypothetical protein